MYQASTIFIYFFFFGSGSLPEAGLGWAGAARCGPPRGELGEQLPGPRFFLFLFSFSGPFQALEAQAQRK